jgi:hypothetical protein
MTMKSIRIAIAAATFAAVSSVAFASDANAGQSFGRDSVYATGKSIAATSISIAKFETVSGRQGGLPLSAKLAVSNNGKSRMVADLVNKSGRA